MRMVEHNSLILNVSEEKTAHSVETSAYKCERLNIHVLK